MYAKNVESFLSLLLTAGPTLVTSYADEILAASLLTQDGNVVHKPTAELLAGGAK
jgi:NAD/NADP transhydrogenase alpha subunit